MLTYTNSVVPIHAPEMICDRARRPLEPVVEYQAPPPAANPRGPRPQIDRRIKACIAGVSKRATSRAGHLNGDPSAAGTSAVMAVETIGPTPGIVISRRAVGSAFERRLISASSAAI